MLSKLYNQMEVIPSSIDSIYSQMGFKIVFCYGVTGQNPLTNKSTLNYELYIVHNAEGMKPTTLYCFDTNIALERISNGSGTKTLYSNANEHTIDIGESVDGWYLWKSGTITTTHDKNGASTIRLLVSTEIYGADYIKADGKTAETGKVCAYGNVRNKLEIQSFEDRAVLITAPSFTNIETPVIEYTGVGNYAVDNIAKIEACLSITGAVDDVPYREIPKPTEKAEVLTYTFSLTEEDLNALYKTAPDSLSGTVRFYLRTTLTSGVVNWYYLDRTFTIVENYTPVVIPTVKDINTTTIALTGDENTLVKYYSDAEFSVEAVGRAGATVTEYYATNGSNTIKNAPVGVFRGVNSGDFTFGATDTRGFSATPVTVNKGFVEYVKLTCVQQVTLELTGETEVATKAYVTVSGHYFNGSFGAVNNDIKVEIRHTSNDGSMSDWVDVTPLLPQISGNTYTLSYTVTGLDGDSAYTFQSRVSDKLTTAVTDEYTARVKSVFDWSETDFVFNVPVTFNDEVTFTSGGMAEFADYVVDAGAASMGSNGTWYWRKWDSGKAECYGCRNFGNMAVTTAYGNLFRSQTFTQALPTGLFEYTPEVIDVSFRGATNYGGWIIRHEETPASTSNTGSFIVARPASATLQAGYVSFNVIGRWK